MYYHIKDRKWFDNRKQAKEHYGIACFRKLLHLKEIIFIGDGSNDIPLFDMLECTYRDLSDGKQ